MKEINEEPIRDIHGCEREREREPTRRRKEKEG